jgi:hypothetical protein
LKRGWMPFWRAGSALLLTCIPAQAWVQVSLTSSDKTETKVVTPVNQTRNDELTLAGLRPGRDDLTKAERLFHKPDSTELDGASHIWQDRCRRQVLAIIPGNDGVIAQVRVAQFTANSKRATGLPTADRDCSSSSAAGSKSRWLTGHGLLVGDSCSRAVALYGQPGTRGPSTKDGQQLELLYYAFDWAGPDVPQVMAILCTTEKNSAPAKTTTAGRVVEITLMAPSL